MADGKQFEYGQAASEVQLQDEVGKIKNSQGESVIEVNDAQQVILALSPTVPISTIIDDGTMATADATSLATSESIKTYVDAAAGGGSGSFTDIAIDTDTLVANVSGYADKVGIGTATPVTKLHVIDTATPFTRDGPVQISLGYDASNTTTLGTTAAGGFALHSDDCNQYMRSNDTCTYLYLQHNTSGSASDGLELSLNGVNAGIKNIENGNLNILTTPSGGAKLADCIRMNQTGQARVRLNVHNVTDAASETLQAVNANSYVCIKNTTPHATVTITLPDSDDASQPIGAGCWFEFKDAHGNADTNPITIQVAGGSSDTIDGGTSIVLNQPYAAVQLFVRTTNDWLIGA